MDYEAGIRALTLQVRAVTQETPAPRTAAVTLRFLIQDINDNTPEFERKV